MVSRYWDSPLFTSLLTLFLVVTAPVCAQQSLTWVMADRAGEPFQIISNNPAQTPHTGLLTDILQAMIKDADIPLKTRVRPYKRIRHELIAGHHDFWITYGSPAWLDERVLALGDYSRRSVVEIRYLLAAFASEAPFALDDARGKRMILIHGYTYYPGFHHWLKAMAIEPVYAPSHRHALAMLRQQRADFYLVEEPRLYWQAQQLGIDRAQLQTLDFSAIIPTTQIAFVFDKRIPASTREQLNQALDKLHQSGELEQILQRYR